jgi:hypothetical protein
VPDAGSPFNTTLPSGTIQVGWVIAPTAGAEGVTGGEFIITVVAPEVHPEASVTVKLYVPAARLLRVLVVPVPVIEPGFIVHVPDDGRPDSTTLPVATEQVGWVIVPTVGSEGPAGAVLITISDDPGEVHPAELVTVKL